MNSIAARRRDHAHVGVHTRNRTLAGGIHQPFLLELSRKLCDAAA